MELVTCVFSVLTVKPARSVCASVEPIDAVGGDAVGEAAAVNVGSDTVEDEIADRVRDEVHAAVAREIGKLHVSAVHRSSAAPATPK